MMQLNFAYSQPAALSSQFNTLLQNFRFWIAGVCIKKQAVDLNVTTCSL